MGDERPRAASHDLPRSSRLLEFMTTGWREEERLAGPLECVPYASKRRAELSAAFPGETLVVPSGGYRIRSHDTEFPFRPGSDHFYLTGCDEPDAVVVLRPVPGGHDAVLLRRARQSRSANADFYTDRTGDFWVGRRMSHAEAADTYGIESRDLQDLGGVLRDAGPVRVLRGLDADVDGEVSGDADASAALAKVLAEMRLVKDDWEVAQLQTAVDATVRGFADVAVRLPDAVQTSEALVEGVFYTRARIEGRYVGYLSIAASGPDACTLHWTRNDGPVDPEHLLLLDAGVEGRWLYTADVTRTMPVGGHFSATQRTVYDLVAKAQRAGIDAVRPGAAFRDPHYAAMTVLAEGLADWGLLPHSAAEDLRPDNELYRRYSLHGTSHMLGLDVHDCAKARVEAYAGGDLVAGHVLTVEPGLYFQPDDLTVPPELRGIGIRIEDDVLVTPEGARVLSAALPTAADELESWLRNPSTPR